MCFLSQDFFFKQMRKLRVFKSPTDLMTERVSLLAVSNQYGVIYVAGDNTGTSFWFLFPYVKAQKKCLVN